MAADPRFTQAVVAAMGAAFETALNAGTAAIIEIYGDTIPTDADTAVGAQTLIATLTCSADAGAGADDTPGWLYTFGSITGAAAVASDTATWFRILTQSAGTTIMDGTCGTATSDLIFDAVAITSGAQVDISAFTVLFPEHA